VLQTEDLFLASFGLARGGSLASVEIRDVNGRRLAFFHIAGPGMEDVERDFYSAAGVVVNLRLLKAEVTRLKNLAFQKLREEESRHAREQRRDRPHQGCEPAASGRR
jgi:hypothetical protein